MVLPMAMLMQLFLVQQKTSIKIITETGPAYNRTISMTTDLNVGDNFQMYDAATLNIASGRTLTVATDFIKKSNANITGTNGNVRLYRGGGCAVNPYKLHSSSGKFESTLEIADCPREADDWTFTMVDGGGSPGNIIIKSGASWSNRATWNGPASAANEVNHSFAIRAGNIEIESGATLTLYEHGGNNTLYASPLEAMTLQANNLTINGTLNILDNPSFAVVPTHILEVRGDLDNPSTSFAGIIMRYNGTGTQNILQANTFEELHISNGNRTINFAGGQSQQINGMFSASGTAGNLLSLYSTSGTWQINLQGSKSGLDYLNVRDSDASSSTPGLLPIDPANSTDSGGNTDWFPATGAEICFIRR